jgi:hypothetical protein
VTVPARAVGTAASWNATQKVAIKAGWDAQNGLAAATAVSYDLTQDAYTFENLSVSATAKTVTIKFTTNAANAPIKITTGANGGGNVVGTEYSMTSGVAHTFDIGSVTAARILYINVSGTVQLGYFTQPAAPLYVFSGLITNPANDSGFACPDNYVLAYVTLGVGTVVGDFDLAPLLNNHSYVIKSQTAPGGSGKWELQYYDTDGSGEITYSANSLAYTKGDMSIGVRYICQRQ